ncbi:hypothetical protein M8J77_013951 [Diaphorina citri]|nr:hypothetical protein M8J77_013951 [Diaphorina citri]
MSCDPIEQDEKKRTKRLRPSVESTDKTEKKVKVDTEFQDEFLEALDSCLKEKESNIPKNEILRLFRETKNARNKPAIISQFNFDTKEIGDILEKLVSLKIAPSMKRRIKTLLKDINVDNEIQETQTQSETDKSDSENI